MNDMECSKTPTRRIALVILVLVADLFFTGIIFGWTPLLLLLLEEGQYSELCVHAESVDNILCSAQENRLNLMFTFAAFATNAASLPVGVLLDYCGPKRAIALAGLIQVSGLMMMGFADSQSFDVFLPAYTLLAIGGCITMIGSYPASFLLMEYQTAVLASISCLFDGSSIVFLVLYSVRMLFHTSREVLFMGYAFFAVIVYTLLIWLWHLNEKDLSSDAVKQVTETTTLLENSMPRNTPVSDKSAKLLLKSDYLDYGTLHEAALTEKYPDDEIHELYLNGVIDRKRSDIPVFKQVKTFEFVYILFFASIQVLRTSLYIGTNQKVLANYGDAANDYLYTKIFSLVLPLGFVFIPAIDFIVEKRGLTVSLMFTNALGLLFNAFVLVPVLSVQCLSFVVFTGFRAFLYAVISAYTAKTFGLKNLGTLIGIIFSSSSFMSLLVYPAVFMSNSRTAGDLGVVYWISLLLCVALFPLTECHHQRERARLKSHRALLSKFGRCIRSPFVTTSSQGISYRRSPCLRDPTVNIEKTDKKCEGENHEQRRNSTQTIRSYEGA